MSVDRHSSFGCHVAVNDVAPGFYFSEMGGRGEGMAHLSPFPFASAGSCS